jgi:hypothetical protein
MSQGEQLARNPVHGHDPDNNQSPCLLSAVVHRADLCGNNQCHPYEYPHQHNIVQLHPVPEEIARLPNHGVEREHRRVVVGSTP